MLASLNALLASVYNLRLNSKRKHSPVSIGSQTQEGIRQKLLNYPKHLSVG